MKQKMFIVLVSVLSFQHAASVTLDCDETQNESTKEIESTARDFSLYFSPVSTCFEQTQLKSTQDFPQFSITVTQDLYEDEHDLTMGFQEQKSFCDCLNSRPGKLSFKGDDLFSKEINASNSEAFSLAHLNKIITNFGKRSNYTHNMMILQAQTMGKDMAINYNLNRPASVNNEYQVFVGQTVKANIKKNITLSSAGTAEFDRKVDNIIKNAKVEDKGKSILDVLSGQKIKGESCYPMKEFLAINSFPQSSTFWTSINNTTTEDWNIDKLVEKFKTTSNKTERDALSDRISFLEKNPFVKLALRSDNKAAATRVLNVMKKQMGSLSQNCADQGYTGCHREFVNKKMENYTQDIAKIFQEQEMKVLIDDERRKEMESQLEGLLTNSKQKTDLSTLKYWAEEELGLSFDDCKGTQKSYESAKTLFRVDSYFFDSVRPEDLEKDRKEAFISCDEKLPTYCKTVGDGPKSILAKGVVEKWADKNKNNIDKLYEDIAKSVSPDPEENWEYQQYAEDQCENIYRFHNGKSVNMVSFEEDYCKSPKAECSDKVKLLEKFQTLSFDEERTRDNPWLSEFSSEPYRTTSIVKDISSEQRSSFKKMEEGLTSIFNPSRNDADKPGVKDSVVFTDSEDFSSLSSDLSSGVASATIPNYVTNNVSSMAMNSMTEMKNGIDEEISATKEAIQHNKERLARPNTTPQFKDEVSERLKTLETILAEKEKSAQEYQNIISKLIANKNSPPSETTDTILPSQPRKTEDSSVAAENQKVASHRPVLNQVKSNEALDEQSRGPASVEAFSTSGGAQGGPASIGATLSSLSSGAVSARKGTINSALLSKYGITVQETDSVVQVAPDKEKAQISQLLSNASKSELGLEVSRMEYDKFKNYDLNALNQIYKEKVESLGTDVVKLLIHAEGEKEALEFYAIKEDGKVVFQPVRKNRLSDLQNALK